LWVLAEKEVCERGVLKENKGRSRRFSNSEPEKRKSGLLRDFHLKRKYFGSARENIGSRVFPDLTRPPQISVPHLQLLPISIPLCSSKQGKDVTTRRSSVRAIESLSLVFDWEDCGRGDGKVEHDRDTTVHWSHDGDGVGADWFVPPHVYPTDLREYRLTRRQKT
jgi:hypothetical protein